MNNRPSYYRNRATTAAIKKPPLGVIATASARITHQKGFDGLKSENDLKDEAEMLNLDKKLQSDITDKEIMLQQYNNLFTRGN